MEFPVINLSKRWAVVGLWLLASCRMDGDRSGLESVVDGASVRSAIPDGELDRIKAALPKVAFPGLADAFVSASTYWYDGDTMTPSYQTGAAKGQAVGVNLNSRWLDHFAEADRPTAEQFFDARKREWKYPFAKTFGMDQTAASRTVKFLALPAQDGKLVPVAVLDGAIGESATNKAWGWIFPNGTVLGAVTFITKEKNGLVAAEVRTMTRYPAGWGMNVYRPFASAKTLVEAIKAKRPNFAETASLKALVEHLESDKTLVKKTEKTTNGAGLPDEGSALDPLPAMGDEALARALLTDTTFVSTYSKFWKSGNGLIAYAAGAKADSSIVPQGYEGGLFPVTEDSCTRCHKETGRKLNSYQTSAGQLKTTDTVFGRDGVFSFHPFDEAVYKDDKDPSTEDNRKLNPDLVTQGLVTSFNAATHKEPIYPAKEFGLGESNTDADSDPPPPPPSTVPNGTIVEFRIKDGTGSGDWNTEREPLLVRPRDTIRVINDDSVKHIMHTTKGYPCLHQPVKKPSKKGEHYDCTISEAARPGEMILMWDHKLGNQDSARFWVKVQ